ncbi:guanylate-binding protein 1-like isoform X2 [Anas acuta]|uniref:guanylate-binding protein 1-like isoform X2 n=1 Tax=Anas acuta TaxID=28680 RepID=UPI0035C91AD0
MASEIQMPEPVCLIENKKGKGLVVQPEALQLLSEITQPMVVVAIAGPYRSGKSYLLNWLAGQRRGFSLGSSVQAHTKGIWMWCVPHPCKPGHTLVLLDTEGLGDTEKGDTENDTWIFVLAVLLSSTLIYNSKGTIDQQAMDNLHYVLKLSECVQVKTAPEEAGEEEAGAEQAGEQEAGHEQPGLDRRALFFSTFVWAVRDFTLQLEVDGKEISEDEYLENALKLKDGSSQEAQSYNRLRECIRQLFPERKCFVFDQPARKKDLPRLEELPDDMLDPEFQQQVERFCSYIGQNCPPKTIPGGREITGSRLGTLAENYVEAIRSGAVPCLESAVLALAQIENSAALKEAVDLYQRQMEQRLPTETTQELLELHARCEEEAMQLFMERAFEESRERFRAELTGRRRPPGSSGPTVPLPLMSPTEPRPQAARPTFLDVLLVVRGPQLNPALAVQDQGTITSLVLLAALSPRQARMPLAFLAPGAHCWLIFRRASTNTPNPFPLQSLPATLPPNL